MFAILPTLCLGWIVFQAPMLDALAQGRPLRIRGTVVRNRYNPDGRGIAFQQNGTFVFDLDPSGKWFVQTECAQVPGVIFQMGYDGRTTVELENHSGTFAYESDTNKTEVLTPETAPSFANIYGGNEYPFDLWPPSQFAWLVLASYEYQSDTNHLGRIGDLFRRGATDPVAFALKVVPQFRKDWPHVLEKAEIFFDINDYPKDPIGLPLPSDEAEFAYTQRQWETLKGKRSGVRVGSVESSGVTGFNGIQLPTQYRLEVIHRADAIDDSSVGIDNRSQEMLLKIADIQEIPTVRGVPEIVSPTVLVKDYRFRKVDETTAMEYLAYTITDKRWKSADDPILLARSDHNKSRIQRFGNKRNQWVKGVGSTVLVLILMFPLIRVIKNNMRAARKVL
jgi:hypothetical protein